MLHSFLWFLCQPHCGLSIAVCHFLFAVVQLLPETKVYDVLDSLASDMTEAEILEDFPDLTHEDIRACLAFAADRERKLLMVVA
jgi:hypothetical protein